MIHPKLISLDPLYIVKRHIYQRQIRCSRCRSTLRKQSYYLERVGCALCHKCALQDPNNLADVVQM